MGNTKTKAQSEILEMKKKELKEYINSNGFFFQMSVNAIDENTPERFENIPEGATYFEGIASTGKLNRNGYIIRASAWKDAIKGYMENPVILLGHNSDAPIGRALEVEVVDDEKLVLRGYIFDEYTENKFSRGLITGLSTGHITLDREFEHVSTGEVISEEDFK